VRLKPKSRRMSTTPWAQAWQGEFEKRGAGGGFLKGRTVQLDGLDRTGGQRRVSVVGDERSLLFSETMAEVRMQAAVVGAARSYLQGLGFAFSKDVPLGQVTGSGISAPVDSPWVYGLVQTPAFDGLRAEVATILSSPVGTKGELSPGLGQVLRDAVLASQIWGYVQLFGEGALSLGFSPSTREKLRTGWLLWGEYARMMATLIARPFDHSWRQIQLEENGSGKLWAKDLLPHLVRALFSPELYMTDPAVAGAKADWYEKLPAAVSVAGQLIPLKVKVGAGELPVLAYRSPSSAALLSRGMALPEGDLVAPGKGQFVPGMNDKADPAALASVLSLFQSGYNRHVRSTLFGHLLTSRPVGAPFDPAWLPFVPAMAPDPTAYFEALSAVNGVTWGSMQAPWALHRSPLFVLAQLNNLYRGPTAAFRVNPKAPQPTNAELVRNWGNLVLADPYRMTPTEFSVDSLAVVSQAVMMLSRGLHPLTGESLVELYETGGRALPAGMAKLIWGPFFIGSRLPDPVPYSRVYHLANGTKKAADKADPRYAVREKECVKGLRALAAAFVWG